MLGLNIDNFVCSVIRGGYYAVYRGGTPLSLTAAAEQLVALYILHILHVCMYIHLFIDSRIYI